MKPNMKCLRQIRNTLLLVVSVYTLSMAVGYLTADPCIQFVNKQLAEHSKDKEYSEYELLILRSLTTPYHGVKRGNLCSARLVNATLGTFCHNTVALALTLYGGAILFFVPLIQKSIMGYGTGVVMSFEGWYGLLRRLTPHGFVELPLTFIVSSFALLLGLGIVKAPANERKQVLLGNLRFATRIYLLSIPFSIIAAVLEVYGRRLMWGQ
jgi:uncharacterized membrane protein SpoIIM required for sporulation